MLRRNYSNIVATLALVIALTTGGAYAGGKFITSKDIKNGSIKTQDIAKNGVRAPDIRSNAVGASEVTNGTIGSAEIGAGEVTPQDVTMPEPVKFDRPASSAVIADVGEQYARVATIGNYVKSDPTSALEVTWTGTAGAAFSPCHFQLRVDAQPGGGEVFVGTSAVSASATALFEGLPAGSSSIEVWAKHVQGGGSEGDCTLGPENAGIAQTFIVSEKVL